jgi:hypothetical protein
MSIQSENDLPFGLPPILPSINEKLEQYLDNPELLPMHNDEPIRFWDRIPQPKRLLFTEIAPLSTTLKVDRDPATGKLIFKPKGKSFLPGPLY